MTKLSSIVALVALAASAGCKKKTHYSANCSRSVALVEPWPAMKLPMADDSRVCSANDLKVDLEYLTGDRAHWEQAYDTALVAQGFVKERCSSTSCSYLRADEKLAVQINQVADGKKAKTIVHLTRTPGKATPAPAAAGSGSANR